MKLFPIQFIQGKKCWLILFPDLSSPYRKQDLLFCQCHLSDVLTLYYLQGIPGAPGPEGQMGAKGDMVMLHHKLK